MAARIVLFALANTAFFSFADAVSTCYADNCLRQLRGNGSPASAYCSSYLTTTHPVITPVPVTIIVTATRTVFAVHSPDPDRPIEYVTRKGAPYIAPNKRKRDLNIFPREPAPAQVTAFPIQPRQAPPSFASSCTPLPDRLSSACTCLIGSTAQASTTYKTNTQKTYTKTVDVCLPTNTNSLRSSYQGDFIDNNASFTNFGFPTSSVQECCNICFHTFNCVAYYIRDDNGQCGILRAEDSSQPQPNDNACSAGLLEIYDPLIGDFPGPYELGLCAYLVYSDE
ncbi:hypothetical protein AA313_de0206636 [Arthrobotrys entomopaga]|nr:hypothetical protein AA313_de0206636 [Arthrobotrys entomopaga]